MKPILFFLFCSFSLAGIAQKKMDNIVVADSTKKIDTVETACGQCQFHLKGKNCTMAVRINGIAYFADGADIDAYGDAHARDGLCNTVRKAAVQGAIVDGRFKVTYYKLLKPEKRN